MLGQFKQHLNVASQSAAVHINSLVSYGSSLLSSNRKCPVAVGAVCFLCLFWFLVCFLVFSWYSLCLSFFLPLSSQSLKHMKYTKLWVSWYLLESNCHSCCHCFAFVPDFASLTFNMHSGKSLTRGIWETASESWFIWFFTTHFCNTWLYWFSFAWINRLLLGWTVSPPNTLSLSLSLNLLWSVIVD